jgi:hypothetical protein
MLGDVTVAASVTSRKIGIREPRDALNQNTSFDRLKRARNADLNQHAGHRCKRLSKMRRVDRSMG